MTNVERIRGLSPQDLLMLGIKEMAYVKDIEVDENASCSVRRQRPADRGDGRSADRGRRCMAERSLADDCTLKRRPPT